MSIMYQELRKRQHSDDESDVPSSKRHCSVTSNSQHVDPASDLHNMKRGMELDISAFGHSTLNGVSASTTKTIKQEKNHDLSEKQHTSGLTSPVKADEYGLLSPLASNNLSNNSSRDSELNVTESLYSSPTKQETVSSPPVNYYKPVLQLEHFRITYDGPLSDGFCAVLEKLCKTK